MTGTSLTNQALNLKELERRSKVDVTLEKCFTKNANYKPKIDIRDIPMEKVEKEDYDWIIIETGVDEVSNLDLRKSESDTMSVRAMCESVDKLLKFAPMFSRLKQGVKVILPKQIAGFDCKKRMAWGEKNQHHHGEESECNVPKQV